LTWFEVFWNKEGTEMTQATFSPTGLADQVALVMRLL